jgi:hypothetical protein
MLSFDSRPSISVYALNILHLVVLGYFDVSQVNLAITEQRPISSLLIWQSQHSWWHLSVIKLSVLFFFSATVLIFFFFFFFFFPFSFSGRAAEGSVKVLTKSLLDISVDGKLACRETANHEQTGWKTRKRSAESKLSRNLDKTGDDALTRQALCLIDLGQHSISWLRNNCSGETSDKTRSQVDSSLGAIRQSRLVQLGEDGFGDLLESNKLCHSIRDPA